MHRLQTHTGPAVSAHKARWGATPPLLLQGTSVVCHATASQLKDQRTTSPTELSLLHVGIWQALRVTRCIVRQSWDVLGELYLNYYEDVLPLCHFIFLIQNHIELRDSSLRKEPMRSCFSSSVKYTWPRRIWHSSPHLHHYAVKLTYYVFTTILTTISSLHTITDTLSLLQHERNPLFLPLDDQHTGLFSQRGSGSALHSQPVSLNGRPGIWCTSSF